MQIEEQCDLKLYTHVLQERYKVDIKVYRTLAFSFLIFNIPHIK